MRVSEETTEGHSQSNRNNSCGSYSSPEGQITKPNATGLRRIDGVPSGNSIELDRPVQTIRAWLGGPEITRFDGRKLFTEG